MTGRAAGVEGGCVSVGEGGCCSGLSGRLCGVAGGVVEYIIKGQKSPGP
jgi:hypothetical protein